MAENEVLKKSLQQLDEDINTLLNDKNLSAEELMRGILRSQRAIIPFLLQVTENTQKITVMWGVFKPAVAVAGLLLASIVGFLWAIFTGQIEIVMR